jgi:molecular chaperone HtpG
METTANNNNNTAAETFAFQAEINQLLSLIINTFYSNKDVFLRELISNASDAIDKIRYASLTDPDALGEARDLDIKIVPDKIAKTLTIQDSGIGMTKQELIKNLGTIAHSGTRAFMESIQAGQTPDMSLIGQFGVGFYSAYLVAKNVKVTSKHNGDPVQYIWESNASGSFEVREDVDGLRIQRGTKIVLELKDDQLEYLEESRIRDIVKKHSEFCVFPVRCWTEREEEVEVEAKADGGADEEGVVEEVTAEAPATAPVKEKRIVAEFKQLNTQQPVWQKKPEDVTPEEYAQFYKSISNDWDDYLDVKHFFADGQVQFKAALFIPKRPPFDMFQSAEKKRSNVKLYVKKVLITDDSTSILPDYLGFVQGVVDSDDLPLNVSREMLQQNSVMRIIRNSLVKKIIEKLSSLATSEIEEERARYQTFYSAFSKNLKLGVHDDAKNRPKLLELVRYHTSKSEEQPSSLKDYVARMKEGQSKIYYVTGESLKAVKLSPFIEKLRQQDIEVLFMTDAIDEYMVQSIREYDGKELVCCSKEGLELETKTDDEKKTLEDLQKDWEPVCGKLKATLGDKVVSVKLSDRLSSNPCVLVTDRYGWSANMERIMKAQALSNSDGGMMGGGSRKILEINAEHPILLDLKARVEKSTSEKTIKHIVDMLYSTALLDSGFALEEPNKYAQQIYKIMTLGLAGDEEEEETEAVAEAVGGQEVVDAVVETTPLEEVD